MDQTEDELSLEALRRIDTICRWYELARRNGQAPNLAVFHDEASEDAERSVLKRELLALDGYYRNQNGREEASALGDASDLKPDSAGSTATLAFAEAEHGLGDQSAPEIPGYEVLRELGRGGMGVVYEARQRQLNRIVALKMILSGGHAGPEELKRFRTEVLAIASVQHPQIVQIYEVGNHKGLPFYSLEYCAGGTLASRLAGTPLAPREAAALVEQLARGIQVAHAKEVIHRDLKPANVLFADDGTPRISDFGLAKKLDEDGRTVTGAVLGTPSYMAPEQASGQTGQIGPACDIYALGAILYECLTGRPPFRAATPLDTVMQVISAEPVPPRQLNAHVPRDLETICLTCLHKMPARRYATALAMAEDLRRFQADEPIVARPVGRVERLTRWCRRNPLLATTSAAAILLLVLVALGSAIAALMLDRERKIARDNEEDAKDNLARALAAERESADKLRASLASQAQALCASGHDGRRFESLAALKKAAAIRPSLALRNQAIAAMALFDLRVAREWDGCPGDRDKVRHLVFDESLRHYARADADGNISVRRTSDDHDICSLPGLPGKVAATIALRPDGKQLAVCYCPEGKLEDNVLCLWDIVTGKKVLELTRQAHRRAMAFSPDGALLALGCQDRTLRLYDTATGDEVRRRMLKQLTYSIHFHPREEMLALVHSRSIVLHDLSSGNTKRTLPLATDAVELAWHPDGEVLAGAVGERIVLWNARSGSVLRTLEGHPDSTVTVLAFSRGGDLLASTAWDNALKVWRPATGALVLTVPNVDLRSWGPALRFSPDDKLLAYNVRGFSVQLWEVARSRECIQLYGTGQRDADIHPDGRLAVVCDVEGVRFWDLERERDLGFLPLRDGRSAFFHPDGQSIITSGQTGLRRWPLVCEESGVVRIGPPQTLWMGSSIGQAVLSVDGKRVAAASYGGQGAMIDLAELKVEAAYKPHTRMTFVSLSPDGQWLATGGWEDPHVKIWNARTGEFAGDLPESLRGARVQFSPDGRWLVTGTADAYRFWETGSWKLARRIDRTGGGLAAPIAFSPDGGLVALVTSPNVVRLIGVQRWEEIATLAPADRRKIEGLRFSGEGSRLAVSALGVLQVWDLRRVRASLAEMGLDWDAPAYAPMPDRQPRAPLQLKVVIEPHAK